MVIALYNECNILLFRKLLNKQKNKKKFFLDMSKEYNQKGL